MESTDLTETMQQNLTNFCRYAKAKSHVSQGDKMINSRLVFEISSLLYSIHDPMDHGGFKLSCVISFDQIIMKPPWIPGERRTTSEIVNPQKLSTDPPQPLHATN
jgi:hypothetical protein